MLPHSIFVVIVPISNQISQFMDLKSVVQNNCESSETNEDEVCHSNDVASILLNSLNGNSELLRLRLFGICGRTVLEGGA